jgi:hypothetical protein
MTSPSPKIDKYQAVFLEICPGYIKLLPFAFLIEF